MSTQRKTRSNYLLIPKYLLIQGFILVLLANGAVSQAAKPAKTDTKKSATSASANDSATKPKTASHRKEPKPVIDEATRKSITDTALRLDVETRKQLNQAADTIQREDQGIYNEVRDDEELALTDIGMLWEAAVERSGTIRYAIEKLSRRDATGKPVEADNFSKRMIGSLVHLGGVAGSMWTGTPAGLIGSGMIQDMMAGSPTDPALARVTDADMVILAKEVEELQSQLITLYYDYKHAKERLTIAKEAERVIEKYGDQAEASGSTSEALKPLMQSLVESAKQDVQSAEQSFHSSRVALSGLVGPAAITALEQATQKSAAANP